MLELTPMVVVSNYAELVIALRERADELELTREDLDHLAELSSGYAAKLLLPNAGQRMGAPSERGRLQKGRALGPQTLGPLLKSLGLRLIVAHDPEAADRAVQQAFGRKSAPVSSFYRRVHKFRAVSAAKEQAAG